MSEVADFIEQPWLTEADIEKWEERRQVIYDLVKKTAFRGEHRAAQWSGEPINLALRGEFGRDGDVCCWYVKPERGYEAIPHPIGTEDGEWRLYPLQPIPEAYICQWTDKELKRLGYNKFEIVRDKWTRTGEIELDGKRKKWTNPKN